MAAVANITVEIMNSPDKKPKMPAKNINPVAISLLKSFILKPFECFVRSIG